MVALLTFIAAGAVIILASTRIVHYADIVAERTRLGQLWVGATMLAAVTSLPELATDISAVRIDAKDLAAGDLFGSSMANMLIFSILSLWFARLWRNHRFGAVEWFTWTIALLVTAEAMLFILFDVSLQVLSIGLGGILITATYLVGARAVFQRSAAIGRESRRQELAAEAIGGGDSVEPAEITLNDQPLRRTFAIFFAWSALVLVAAPFLANAAEELAEITNLGDTFFGVISLAILTSLPELASSIAAFRRGLPSMVLGNLLGSNGFNMLIILALDISLPRESFLQVIDEAHAPCRPGCHHHDASRLGRSSSPVPSPTDPGEDGPWGNRPLLRRLYVPHLHSYYLRKAKPKARSPGLNRIENRYSRPFVT